ncbi:MAG: hypothetical protein ACOYLQ_13315 [Hyphomicrobiaceae bacterium]|jgi:hypothetical protein
MTIANPWLLGAGIAALVIGYLLRRWASRHNLIEVATDAALSAAWTTVTTRRLPGVPEEITSRVRDVTDEVSHAGKAGKVAGLAARHVVAQAAGLAGLVLLALGLGLVGVALYWR